MKIVITGPESTGKTSIVNFLSTELNTIKIDEYARTYLEKTKGKYQYEDLLIIAKHQIEQEEKCSATKLNILDTDLITIKIWSEYKYGKCDPWIITQINERQYDYYLLCYPDINWEYDPLRENPNDLKSLFVLYENELINQGKQYSIITGTGQSRYNKCINILNNI